MEPNRGFVGRVVDYLSSRIKEYYKTLVKSAKDAPTAIHENKSSLDELLNKIM